MEFELDGRALVKEGSNGDAGPNGMVRVKGHSFRLPTSRDLACAAESNDHQTAAIRLVERCRMGAGESPAWSVEDLEEIGEALSLADPSAEPQVALRCPACNDEWNVTLDLATFLWAEIEARAKRLLWEVHTLASVYGWTQREILSLGEVRRNLYLEMVRA
ncbi:MAG TPA: hypothetical protein VK763_06205 [Terriglobales bacterium]|nr:hypothetical protein [Terriglobales bacterium]